LILTPFFDINSFFVINSFLLWDSYLLLTSLVALCCSLLLFDALGYSLISVGLGGYCFNLWYFDNSRHIKLFFKTLCICYSFNPLIQLFNSTLFDVINSCYYTLCFSNSAALFLCTVCSISLHLTPCILPLGSCILLILLILFVLIVWYFDILR